MSGIKVVYILGAARSGSTLLGNLLGEMAGFFHAGELRTLWTRGVPGTRLCGCGRRIRECDVWSAILEACGDDGSDEGLPARVARSQRDAVRFRHTSRLLRMARGNGPRSPSLDRYLDIASRTYRAIGDVTGSRVVVDSSKRPADAALLMLVPGVSPHYVHLVRDPRAVVHSWSRHSVSAAERVPPVGPIGSVRKWTSANLASEAVLRRAGRGRSLRIRYEDFVAEPEAVLGEIGRGVGEEGVAPPRVDGGSVEVGANHTVGGNPNRFAAGTVRIRLDDEWLTGQRSSHRAIATSLSLPLLRRYGYPVRPGRAREAVPAAQDRGDGR